MFNTYGELGNAELVKKYGFALRDNPFTVVTLNKRSVVNACATQIEAADQKSTSTGQPSKRAKRGKEGASSGAAPGDGLLGLLETETSLLDEDEEPFEVMANGHMGPALFITLRMLCSGADGGAAFTCVEDALRLPAPEDSSDAEAAPLFIDPEDIGAVPVRLMTSQNDAAAAAVADAEGINGKGVGSGAQSHPCSGMISPAMCRALHQAVTMRLAGYPTSLAETCEELREFEKRVATGRAGALGEGEAAVRAALVLRASEQGVLEDMLAALESRRGQK